MVVCESCQRHVRESDARCPFCSRPSSFTRARNLAGVAFTTFVLSACYGTGITDKTPSTTDCLDGGCTETGQETGETGNTTTTP